MAFGFLKKIAQALTGKKSAESQDGAKKKRRRGGRGRGKGGNGQQQQNGGQQQRQKQQQGQQKQRQQQGQPQKGGDQRGDRPQRRDGGQGSRGQRGGRGRRGPAPVNTAANEMRPGGEISAEELKARQEAHAKWDPASFAVEPVEGKKRFHDFNLPSEVMHGIADLGFKYCTEIQALSLEQALAGKNIAGKAQTGSGKTAAFLVAILTRYLRTPENRAKEGGAPRALVIAPTRELVIQICKDADAIGKYTGLRSLAVYGGMDYDRQRH